MVENALHAHVEAERTLAGAEGRGAEVGVLREQLRMLHDMLAGLDQERREGA